MKLEAALLVLLTRLCCLSAAEVSVKDVQENLEVECSSPQLFCYKIPRSPGWRDAWTRIQVRVNSAKTFKVAMVNNAEKLEELDRVTFWGLLTSFMRQKFNETYFDVDLFSNKTCFKVEPSDKSANYTVLVSRSNDTNFFLLFLAGLLLFFYAETFSRSQLFYYSSGISVGMVASLIILVFILSRFLPKKSSFYLLLVTGSSLALYIIQLVFKNLQDLLKGYWEYVLGYILVVGFISFAVCYRYGPLVDERSMNILCWTLQLIGLVLMYVGIQVRQVAVALIIVAFCTKNLEYPVQWTYTAYRKACRITAKPSPPRFLTEEEYRKQGEVETRKALEDLRQYCTSPEFSPWKTVSRIQSPKRLLPCAKKQTQ
ncbi:nuclear envelope integral membrane protein 1 isoform X2 [Latimeria chalumnae]|uniref:nuclear envelope integral membrane protein 1 isoform X2 n=1 Tax=Latimeria chalumnae TaxID=7897 RepID=UPI00313EB033